MIKHIGEYIEDSSVGEKWEVEIIDMTEEEYNLLPEFEGW